MASAGRLRFGRVSSGAPILNNIAYTFGTWTYPTSGRVSLTSLRLTQSGTGKPFVDLASGPITSWSVVGTPTGAPTHWNYAADIAAGMTPSITGAGFRSTTVTVITVRATGPGGTADATITITPDNQASTYGDTGDTFDYQVINSAANVAYTTSPFFRRMLIATGISDTRMIAQNNSFAFTGVVTVQDADPLRPSRMVGFATGGGSNIEISGLTCAGYNSTSYLGNIVLQGTNISATNCKVLDTEYTYNSSVNNNFAGFVVQGASTTATLTFSKSDTMATTHKYRGIILEGCTSVVINYAFLGFSHAQGVWISPNAKNITFIEPIIVGIFRTRYYNAAVGQPVPDFINHQEPWQVGDAGNGTNGYPDHAVAGDPLIIKGAIFAPLAFTNSGGRGLVLGGAGRYPGSPGPIVPTVPGQVIADGIVSLGWIADMLECYGFGPGSRIERVFACRCDVGDTAWAASVGDEDKVPGYDVTGSAARVRIDPDPANIASGATIDFGEIYAENLFSANADALAVATLKGDIYSYNRTVMTAGNGALYGVGTPDPVGFAAADPKTSLESFFNGLDPATVTWQQIRDGVASRLNRPDGKGPFANTTGNPWRYV